MIDYINDIDRIQTLLSYTLDDAYDEGFYATINNLIATTCATPITFVSFIDDKKQWYCSSTGLDFKELPVEETICQFTLLEQDILEIQDTLNDERLTTNPHVAAENGIRFYAGVPIRSKNGHTIGTVCAADFKPQQLTHNQRESMRDLAQLVMLHLESKKRQSVMERELKDILADKIAASEKVLSAQDTIYNHLLTAIAQSNPVVEFATDGTILDLNNRFAEMVGYSREELLGQKHSLLADGMTVEQQAVFWNKLASGKPAAGKFRRKTKTGDVIWVQSSYSPVIDMDGKITKITHISTDITTDVKAIDALEELSKQKDHFIANISHELRSPIHAILGFTELLLERETDPVKSGQLQSIRVAGDSLLHLVNGILDLSKIEAGLFRFDTSPFSLRTTVADVFSILQVKAARKHLDFRFEIPADIPDALVGDKNRLSQVLINLLDNALKFTDKGGVLLTISQNTPTQDSVELTFKVIDSGIGISAEKLERIFGRFTQAEEDTAHRFGGTGLGLNICKLLVEKQGGTIDVSSTPGKGAVFSFRIHFGMSKQHQQSEKEAGPTTFKQLKGRVLMCEDNELNKLFANQLFADTAIQLDIAGNGIEGIELFRKHAYDLVLMDIQMPEMDGMEATSIIREELKSTVPIIALTAHAIVKEKQACLAIGMNDYLTKPFRKAELFEKMHQWLSPQSETAQHPPISLDFIREASGGNTAFELEVLQLFMINSKEALELIQEAYTQRNYAVVAAQAHKLKTTFGILGLDSNVLTLLEKETDTAQMHLLVQQLERQLAPVQQYITDYITNAR